MGRLDGKVAIITGGARGQGEAEARLFCDEGAKVVIGDVLEEEGRAVAADIGEACTFVPMDVRRPESWKLALDAAASFGTLNVLVNNAAVMHFESIEKHSLEDYMRVVEINQVGCFLGMQAVIPVMKAGGGGSIVNVSSIDGLQAKNGIVGYAASKWAIRGMTKVAALELGHHGIRVNSLHPGGVDTVMGNPTGMDTIDQFYKDQAIPRCGRSEDIARMALFVASDDCSYSTGSEFVCDGGWAAGTRLKWLPGAD
jgi:3alpha(or 20beta)-hydroxysteroid dehydrogenase